MGLNVYRWLVEYDERMGDVTEGGRRETYPLRRRLVLTFMLEAQPSLRNTTMGPRTSSEDHKEQS
jgi:hypothetical protein